MTLTLLSVTACQGVPLSPAGTDLAVGRQVVVSPHAGGTITLRILPPTGLQTQAAAKTFANVSSLNVKLLRSSNSDVVADSGPIVPDSSVSTVTFTNVTTGVVYQLKVDAFDVDGNSIVKGGPQPSGAINVTTATTHSVSMNLFLKDATGGSVPFQITPPGYLTGEVKFQVWLRNQATDVVVAMPALTVPTGVTTSKTLRDLDDGAYSVWVAARNSTVSTPAKMCGTINVAGGVTTEIKNASGMVVASLSTGFASGVTNAGGVPGAVLKGLTLDSFGVPFVASTTPGYQAVYRISGGGASAYVGSGTNGNGADGMDRTGNVITNPGACAIDSTGAVFVADSGNDKLRIVPQMTTPSYGYGTAFTADKIYTLRDDINIIIGTVAVAPAGELYYNDGRNVLRVLPMGGASTLLSPQRAVSPLGMKTDRWGNLFAVGGTQLDMYVVRNGTYFNQARTASNWHAISTLPGNLRDVAVDPIGNVYVSNDAGVLRMIETTDSSKFYVVAGNGASAIADGLAPTDALMPTVWGIGVHADGSLYFAANSSVWRF